MGRFDIKKPCRDCPFRKDGVMLESLREGRIEEILTNVLEEDGFFPCHKTVDYNDENSQGLQDGNQFCAGALIALEKADKTLANRNTRIGRIFNMYDPADLSGHDEVIEPKDYLKRVEK